MTTATRPVASWTEWFAGSCLTDPDGVPLILHHATPYHFDPASFDTRGFSAHFGDKATAAMRMRQGSARGMHQEADAWHMLDVVLALKNPLELPDFHDWDARHVLRHLIKAKLVRKQDALDWAEQVLLGDQATGGTVTVDPGMARFDRPAVYRQLYDGFIKPKLSAAGYDSVVYRNDFEGFGARSWIVFRPDQIRDATSPEALAWRRECLLRGAETEYPSP